ncbi:hypothetical protein AAFH68_49620 [Flavobacterium sp. CGRL1]
MLFWPTRILLIIKKQIRSLTHNSHLIDSLNQSAKTYKEELEKVSRDLDVCRQIYQNQ